MVLFNQIYCTSKQNCWTSHLPHFHCILKWPLQLPRLLNQKPNNTFYGVWFNSVHVLAWKNKNSSLKVFTPHGSLLWLRSHHLWANTIQCILNWPLPIGAFQGQWNNQQNNRTQQQQLLRIPTGRRQTSWLFTSAAGKLNQGLPGSNSTSGQSGSWTRDLRISRQAPGWDENEKMRLPFGQAVTWGY